MAATPPLDYEEVRRVLTALEPLADDRQAILVGGQAVAFWAMFLREQAQEQIPLLASKDIDFEGSRRSVRRAGELLDGEVRIPQADHHTPNTGIVVFVDSEGIEREIDFVGSPLGLDARDVRRTAVKVRFPIVGGEGEFAVYLIHPERSMESRIYNAAILGKTSELALGQLRTSITSARVWSQFLLDQKPRANRRDVLNLNERIFRKCVRDMHFRRVYADHGIDAFDAVLVDERLGKEFVGRRYPQMIERLGRDQASG